MVTQIVLIGPPGVGKSTVGALVAQRWGAPHLDTDHMVEQRCGKTVSDIFIEDGEPAFREAEAAAVAEALTQHPAVVSLGGGAVMNPQTAAALEDHPAVVFLCASLSKVARRNGFDQGRPLLALNPRGTWVTLMEKRRPTYERVSNLTVDTDDLAASDVADQVWQHMLQEKPHESPE